MSGDAERRARTFYQSISGQLIVAATDDDQTLVTVKNANYQLYIQRVIVYITTDAAQSWSFEDSNSSAVKVCKVTTSPGVDTRWDFDFGAQGRQLTAGKNFLLNMSAAGLAGHIEWLGYQKLVSGTASSGT